MDMLTENTFQTATSAYTYNYDKWQLGENHPKFTSIIVYNNIYIYILLYTIIEVNLGWFSPNCHLS